MTQKPENGVFVEEDSDSSRRVRLQAGDIIVGVDGWKVENKEQYDAVINSARRTRSTSSRRGAASCSRWNCAKINGMELQDSPAARLD